jgi:hypothetical protein
MIKMEELIPNLSNLLNNTVEIRENKEQLLIELKIKKEDLIPGDLGKPHEVKEMIRVFGGVKQDIPIDVVADEKTKIITLKLLNKEDFEIIRTAIKNLWERVSDLLIEAFNAELGKIGKFKDLGDFDEAY